MYATKTVSSQTTSGWIPMDDNQAAFNASVAVAVSGTLTYSVEFTLDNVQDPTITPTVFSTTLVGATASQSLAVHYPVKAFRLNVTAFTAGSATITVLQGSSWDGAATVGNSLAAELAAIYRPAPFPDFAPRLLASLVASSTAACTSGVVTVTATAHGIPAALFDGYQFYYPGSPSLAAGWYGGLSRTGVNDLTFLAPASADFGSESVNAGAIVSSEVTFCSVDLPANAIQTGDIVSVRTFRHGDAISSLKILRVRLGGTNIAQHNISTSAVNGITSITFAATQANKQDGIATIEGLLSATRQQGNLDTSTSLALALTGQLAVAAQYLAIAAAKIRIE